MGDMVNDLGQTQSAITAKGQKGNERRQEEGKLSETYVDQNILCALSSVETLQCDS